MRILVCALLLLAIAAAGVSAQSLGDTTGVVRVFGDTFSWMSSCFVIGDGSWVLTTYDSIVEQISSGSSQTIRYPMFVSSYTGQAYQCELKASNKELNVALLKLPISGLPAAPLAKITSFAKAASGTMGQLSSGEQVGNNWPTDIYGITLDSQAKPPKLGVNQWKSSKVFVADVGKYKWVFISGVNPPGRVPNGSIVGRDGSVVGVYVSKVRVIDGKNEIVYGRCSMSSEIARYCSEAGIDSDTLYDPPKATVTRPEDADIAFQLQSKIYSQIGAHQPALALQPATALVKMRPKDAQARMCLGLAEVAAGKAEDAIKTFDEALALDPKLPGLHTNRALALMAQNKNSEAEAELLKSVEVSPNDPRPVAALASFYLGDEKAADKAYIYASKAAMMNPDSPAAELLVAKTEKSKKDYKAAIASITSVLKTAPEWGEALYALGSTYEESGDIANAEKAYRTLVEKQPKDPSCILTLASFLADQGRKDEARELIDKLRDMNPPKPVLQSAQELQDKIDGKTEKK